jgi:hypothetical protein
MILTALDIIKDAMTIINAVAIEESPTAAEAQLGLRVLNSMVDSWSAQELPVRSTTLNLIPLIAGKSVYTIGPFVTADCNSGKPISIKSAFIRDGVGVDSGLEVLPQVNYDLFANDKSFALGRPTMIAYDPGAAQQASNVGSLLIYTPPDTSYTLHLESNKYMTEFALVSDTVTFEPAYYEAITYALAVRLYRFYHADAKQLPVDIVAIAKTAKQTIENLNSTKYTSSMDIPGKVSTFNIYSGTQN